MVEKNLSEKESLALITRMIVKARDSYRDTGIGAMMWGAVIAVCSLVKLSELHFGYRLPFDIYWLTILAVVPQVFITIREKRERKMKSYDDTYMDYIWLAFGISIFMLIFIVNIMFQQLQPMVSALRQLGAEPGFKLQEYISALFLLLYGLPTFVTGAACRFRPMLWGGLFCWACSIASLFTSFRIDLLLTACAAIVAWFVPGLIMEKEYRLYKKETQMNV